MPNWVLNTVILDFTNATEKGKQYLSSLLAHEAPESITRPVGRPGLFGMILPMPENMDKTSPGDVFPDWYNWACANWGCKWDVDEFDLEQDGNKVRLHFTTANAEPQGWIAAVEAEGVAVEAYAAEPGNDWASAYVNGLYNDYDSIVDYRERFDEFPVLKEVLAPIWESHDDMSGGEGEDEGA